MVFVNGEFLDTGRQTELDHGYVVHLAYDTILLYLAPGHHLPKDTVRRLTRDCQPDKDNFEQIGVMGCYKNYLKKDKRLKEKS